MKFQFDKVRMDSANGHKLIKPIRYGYMLKLDSMETLVEYHKIVHAKIIKKGFDDHLDRIKTNKEREKKGYSNVTGHWSSAPAIVIDNLIGMENIKGNDVSLLDIMIKYELLLLSSKIDTLNKGRILYLRRNGVSTPFGKGMTIENTIIKDELIYPQEGKIEVFKWPKGKHYYATFDGEDVIWDGKQKWNTKKAAEINASVFRREHYGKIDESF